MGLNLATLSGGATAISREKLDALRARVRGTVLTDGDEGYEAARSVWNAMIDRRPAVIVRCAGAADVRTAVDFARETGAVLSVRGGGHNIAGSAVCDGGVMIDLSPMKSVRIDPFARTARVEPGVTLGEFDREAQSFGLITPDRHQFDHWHCRVDAGRRFRLDQPQVRADRRQPDQRRRRYRRWAARSRVRGREPRPVLGYPRRWRQFRHHHLVRVPPARARARCHVGPDRLSAVPGRPTCSRDTVEIMAAAPDELSCWFVLRAAPPLPFLPQEVHGTGIIASAACYAGPMDAAEVAMRPLREIGRPIADVIGPHPFVGWQAALDPLINPGSAKLLEVALIHRA